VAPRTATVTDTCPPAASESATCALLTGAACVAVSGAASYTEPGVDLPTAAMVVRSKVDSRGASLSVVVPITLGIKYH
jgi:hypothetical protein